MLSIHLICDIVSYGSVVDSLWYHHDLGDHLVALEHLVYPMSSQTYYHSHSLPMRVRDSKSETKVDIVSHGLGVYSFDHTHGLSDSIRNLVGKEPSQMPCQENWQDDTSRRAVVV